MSAQIATLFSCLFLIGSAKVFLGIFSVLFALLGACLLLSWPCRKTQVAATRAHI
jgi:hypothetical protein